MSIEYEKYHGTGNDFVIVDADEYVPDRAAFARTVCDRREGVGGCGGEVEAATTDHESEPADVAAGDASVGSIDDRDSIGADGILFLALEPDFSPPRVVMTLVQPDGSTAAMCGNGARCAAGWAAERTGADTIMIDTQAGTRRAEIGGGEITIEMGRPSFAPGDVPLAPDREEPLVEESVAGVEVTAVNTGVPHAVAFVEDVEAVDLEGVAPEVRHADAFPEGANITFASARESGFDQRTFERGVEGETRSCGTGAVAIAAAARRLGLTDRDSVEVHPPGGRLDVTIRDGQATLTGPVEREFEGEVSSTPGPRRVGEA